MELGEGSRVDEVVEVRSCREKRWRRCWGGGWSRCVVLIGGEESVLRILCFSGNVVVKVLVEVVDAGDAYV